MKLANILGRAWQITWKYKVLWIFGILGGCNIPLGFQSNIPYRLFQSVIEPTKIPSSIGKFLSNYSFKEQVIILIILITVISFIFVFIMAVLNLFGQAVLIKGSSDVEHDGITLEIPLLLKAGAHYFWRLFGIYLIFGILSVLLIILSEVVIYLSFDVTKGIGLVCLSPLICIFIPLVWSFGIYLYQAYISSVVGECGIVQSIQRGWQVFKQYIGNMLLTGLILNLGINGIGGFILSVPITVINSSFITSPLSAFDSTARIGPIITNVLSLAYLPVYLILQGILTTYVVVAWTLNYLVLTRPSIQDDKSLDQGDLPPAIGQSDEDSPAR